MKILPLIGQSTAIALLLSTAMAIAPTDIFLKDVRADENPLTGATNLPTSLTLSELDGSWQKFRISGQYEFADLVKTWSSLIGLSTYNNTYFTQGKTVKILGKTYLVAYRFPVTNEAMNLTSMFSSWQLPGDCEAQEMPDQTLTLDTRVSLSLLNPESMGSLNDIQNLDVNAEIQQSKEQAEARKKACQEAVMANIKVEALQYVGSMNRGQQAYALEMNKFTANIDDLGLGLPGDTDDYHYSFESLSPDLIVSRATAKSENGYHIVGAVAVTLDNDYSYTISIICESTEAGGDVPDAPKFNSNLQTLTCPMGTTETYY